MRINDLAVPPGKFVDSTSSNAAFTSVFGVPSGVGTGAARAPMRPRLFISMIIPKRALQSEPIPSHSLIGSCIPPPTPGTPASPTALPCSGCIFTWARRRAVETAGTVPPAAEYEFGPGGYVRRAVSRRKFHARDGLWLSLRPLPLPPHLSPRCPPRPTAIASSLWSGSSSCKHLAPARHPIRHNSRLECSCRCC